MHRSLGAGGIEAMVCSLANEMAKGQDVTVCTVKGAVPADLYYSRLSERVKKDSVGDSANELSPLRAVFGIFRYIRRGGFDVVHLHGFFYFYCLAVVLLHGRTKFFYTVHSDALKENNPWDLRLLWLKRFCFKRGWLHPITISAVCRESFRTLYGLDSKLITNGIARPVPSALDERTQLKHTEATRVFIHVGRIAPEKTQPLLCVVFDRLVREGEDVMLLFAGPLHVRAVMEQMEPYLGDRIRYLGERHDIPSLMAASDALCMASLYEGLPVVLLEALSLGCIPVCTPVGGIVDVIQDGHNGLLSGEVSPESYYTAVRRFLALSGPALHQMRANALSSFEQYTIEKTAAEYLSYYQQVIGR